MLVVLTRRLGGRRRAGAPQVQLTSQYRLDGGMQKEKEKGGGGGQLTRR